MDDELRRLFTDDRLEVPVRGGADATIVAGAHRIRRRRMTAAAAGGAAAVAVLVGGAVALAGTSGPQSLPPASSPPSVTPTAESAPAPVGEPASPPPASPGMASGSQTIVKPSTATPKPPPKVTIGPTGYAGLRLGMTAAQAEATGLLVPNAQPVSSKGCKGYDYKGSPNQPNHYSVLVSDTYGVVRIAGRSDAVTAEGVGVGAAESELTRIYPTQAGSHGAIGEWVTAVPKNANARYWIILRNAAVSEIRIELAVQDCYA